MVCIYRIPWWAQLGGTATPPLSDSIHLSNNKKKYRKDSPLWAKLIPKKICTGHCTMWRRDGHNRLIKYLRPTPHLIWRILQWGPQCKHLKWALIGNFNIHYCQILIIASWYSNDNIQSLGILNASAFSRHRSCNREILGATEGELRRRHFFPTKITTRSKSWMAWCRVKSIWKSLFRVLF